MEYTRKRLDLRLTTRAKTAKKLIAKSFDIINEDLTVIDLQKNEVRMDKSLYLGFCILELSQLTMIRFHYKEMIEKYGNRVKLAFIDTDIFIYKIETENIYKDLVLNLDAHDTSDDPPDHTLYSRTNAKVLGNFKVKHTSLAVWEAVGLRSKMYYIFLPGGKAKFTAKRGSRHHVLKHVMHEDYLHTLKILE